MSVTDQTEFPTRPYFGMYVGEGSAAVRDRLLGAADGFAAVGYVELSVAQILGLAGVQAPTLYHHFGDKEGLFTEWAVRSLDRMGAAIQEGTGGAGLEGALSSIADAVRSPGHPDLIQLNRDIAKLTRAESREKVVEALQRTVYEPVYAVLIEGMGSGRLRTEPIHPATAVFLTGAAALRSGGLLTAAAEAGSEWWVSRFLSGFAA
jgi:AcrR family transcriptional regulator